MKISTQTARFASIFGNQEAIKMLCEIGYEALDYSMFEGNIEKSIIYDEKEALKIKDIANSYGVYFNQTHAPFPSFKKDDKQYNKDIIPQLIKSIETTAILGAKHIIVHPIALDQNQFEYNMEFFNSLLKYAKEYNVIIALENMFGRDKKDKTKIGPNVCSTAPDFNRYLDALDSKYFTGCLDIGHAGLVGESAVNMINKLGHNRLKALHVHDNDNKSDLHTLPFTKKLNWKNIMKALKDINYDGQLTLEADNFYIGMPDQLLKDASIFMLKTAKQLVNMFDNA